MSEAQFHLSYDGEAVRAGSMDVYELAPALLAVGDLVRETNRILNGERATASVRVKSDFKGGSFEVGLLLDQTMVEHAKALVFGGIVDPETLVRLIFGGTGLLVITGVIKIYKALKGEKPSNTTIVNTDNSTTIINTGSGQVLNNVDSISAELYGHVEIRDASERVFRPLHKPGIEILTVKKDGKTIDVVTKKEVEQFFSESIVDSSPGSAIPHGRQLLVKVERLSFKEGQVWRFSDGSSTFSARITDKSFLDRVESRQEGFYKGDLLRVDLKTLQQSTPDGKLTAEHVVERVLEHLQPAHQMPLVSPAPPPIKPARRKK